MCQQVKYMKILSDLFLMSHCEIIKITFRGLVIVLSLTMKLRSAVVIETTIPLFGKQSTLLIRRSGA